MFLRDVVRIFCIFSFLSILDTLSLVHWSCDHLTYIVFIFGLYIYIYIDVCYSPIFPCVVSFLSLYICFLFNLCNLLFLFHIKIS